MPILLYFENLILLNLIPVVLLCLGALISLALGFLVFCLFEDIDFNSFETIDCVFPAILYIFRKHSITYIWEFLFPSATCISGKKDVNDFAETCGRSKRLPPYSMSLMVCAWWCGLCSATTNLENFWDDRNYWRSFRDWYSGVLLQMEGQFCFSMRRSFMGDESENIYNWRLYRCKRNSISKTIMETER